MAPLERSAGTTSSRKIQGWPSRQRAAPFRVSVTASGAKAPPRSSEGTVTAVQGAPRRRPRLESARGTTPLRAPRPGGAGGATARGQARARLEESARFGGFGDQGERFREAFFRGPLVPPRQRHPPEVEIRPGIPRLARGQVLVDAGRSPGISLALVELRLHE